MLRKPCINLFTIQELEPIVHGRGRKSSSLDETYLGVYKELLYARKVKPVEGNFFFCSFLISYNSFICFIWGFLTSSWILMHKQLVWDFKYNDFDIYYTLGHMRFELVLTCYLYLDYTNLYSYTDGEVLLSYLIIQKAVFFFFATLFHWWCLVTNILKYKNK